VCVLCLPPPTCPFPLGCHRVAQYPTSLWAKAMATEAKLSLIGDVDTLTAQLDGLCADQNVEDLCKTLRVAFTEHELYSQYLTSLVGDIERAKALLEVFDKVRRRNMCYSVK